MAGIKLKGAAAAHPRSSTGRKVTWMFLVLLVLLAIAWFVITSSPFLKAFVLPRVGNSLHAKIEADSISLSPFSKIELFNPILTPDGGEPVLHGGRIRVRYDLIAILGGDIVVKEILVDSAFLDLARHADGKSNLDPLLSDSAKPSQKKSSPAPLRLDIKSIAFTNVTVRLRNASRGGDTDTYQFGPVNFTAAHIHNNNDGTFDIQTMLTWEKSAGGKSVPSKLAARMRGKFSFSLDPALRPTALQGGATFSVERADGVFADFAGVGAVIHADVSPEQVKDLSLTMTQSGSRLCGVRLSGPFDTVKREGKLNLEVNSVGRHLLNTLAAPTGMDFGATSLSATNEIEIAKGGSVISVFGDLRASQFQIIKAGNSTPRLDVTADYSVAVDLAKKSALVGAFKLNSTQGKRSLFNAGLKNPMTVTWGNSGDTVGASEFSFALSDLQLNEWRPLIGDVANSGKIRAEGKIQTKGDGKVLNFEIKINGDNLALSTAAFSADGLTLAFDAAGEAQELKRFKISEFGAQVFRSGQPAFSFQGSASHDFATRTGETEISILGALPQLGSLFAGKSADISSGVVELRGNTTQKPGGNSFTGKLHLVDLTGSVGGSSFEHFGTELDLDLTADSGGFVLRKAAGGFTANSKPAGNLLFTAKHSPATGATEATARLDNVTHQALRPFLDPYLPNKKLNSASLNSTVAFSIAPDGNKSIKADVNLTNLTAIELRGGRITQPAGARLQLDATLGPKSARLRQCQLSFSPGDKEKNQIALTGELNFPRPNTIGGTAQISGGSLDLTGFHSLLTSTIAPQTSVPKPTTAAASPAAEAVPLTVEFSNFIADVSIDRLVVSEVTAEKILAKARLDGRRVKLMPCSFSLNGAPVSASADFDLGAPGRRYDVNLNAQAVPLAPVMNTLRPANKGQMSGEFTGALAIKGEDTSGASPQKFLAGEISMTMTNINLKLANAKLPLIRSVLDVVVGLPDLIRNPLASVENIVGRLVNFGGQRGGWSDQIMNAPIEVIETRIKAGGGRVQLDQAEVRSATFRARASGEIQLADILTNSAISIPVSLSLNHPLASQIGIIASDAPTNADYYAMPQFLEITGTVGKPDTKIDKLALGSLVLKSGAGVVKGIGGAAGDKVGGIIQKGGNFIGNLIGGKSSTNSPSSTATNQSSGPFDLFK